MHLGSPFKTIRSSLGMLDVSFCIFCAFLCRLIGNKACLDECCVYEKCNHYKNVGRQTKTIIVFISDDLAPVSDRIVCL